jgi:FtsH-binding integral membrane protein
VGGGTLIRALLMASEHRRFIMKTVQKLEFYSGIGVLFAALFQIIGFVFYMPRSEESSLAIILILAFIFVGFPCIAIYIGAYLHATKRNNTGFVILLFVGSIFLCLYGYIILLSLSVGPEMNRGAIIGLIIWLIPSFFVGLTLIFAIINAFTFKSNKNRLQ